MAKDLHSLIRLQSWEVDEKRRKLGEYLRIVESLENRMQQLHDELKREQAAASESPIEAGVLYVNFANAVIAERKSLIESIEKAEGEVAFARDELKISYQQQKKYEMSQETRDKKEEKERKRVEQINLDEVAAESHRQKTRSLI
jgi:flagellar export protein FliJ